MMKGSDIGIQEKKAKQYAGQNARNLNGYNDVQNVGNHVAQNPRIQNIAVDAVNNDEELRLNLDLLEEHRELAAINEARSKSKMTKYYNSRVRGVAFQPRDFVYRNNDASHAAAGGKLGPKWEGPYELCLRTCEDE
nr:reverse transcriptase domain-containing protein [Tanacetum cinerariifolium]